VAGVAVKSDDTEIVLGDRCSCGIAAWWKNLLRTTAISCSVGFWALPIFFVNSIPVLSDEVVAASGTPHARPNSVYLELGGKSASYVILPGITLNYERTIADRFAFAIGLGRGWFHVNASLAAGYYLTKHGSHGLVVHGGLSLTDEWAPGELCTVIDGSSASTASNRSIFAGLSYEYRRLLLWRITLMPHYFWHIEGCGIDSWRLLWGGTSIGIAF